jgi:hypothetical protein
MLLNRQAKTEKVSCKPRPQVPAWTHHPCSAIPGLPHSTAMSDIENMPNRHLRRPTQCTKVAEQLGKAYYTCILTVLLDEINIDQEIMAMKDWWEKKIKKTNIKSQCMSLNTSDDDVSSSHSTLPLPPSPHTLVHEVLCIKSNSNMKNVSKECSCGESPGKPTLRSP